MKYPEFLKSDGTIGIPAPSFGAAIEPYKSRFLKSMEVLRDEGFVPLPGLNTLKNEGIGISNAPEHCAGELTAMFCDGDIDAFISCGGGELMCEILDHIDFERIKAAIPKWFMGYSDNTNFTFLLNTICDTASIYAPCVGDFCEKPRPRYIQDALDLITGTALEFDSYPKWQKDSLVTPEEPFAPFNATEERVHALYTDGEFIKDARKYRESFSFSGRIIGGCLDCLVTLCGTKFDKVAEFNKKYADDGIIWLIESCDLNVFGVRRALWQLKHAGWFENVKGFVFGRPANGGDMLGLDHYEAVLPLVRSLGVPAVIDADFGHCDPMMPVMMGSVAEFRVNRNDMTVKYQMK